MFRNKSLIGLAVAGAALAAAFVVPSAQASADDARLTVTPAVYRVNDSNAPGPSIQPVRYGYYRGGWGPRWGGYGYYRPYARPYVYGGYGYAGPAYGYGYPAYGYPAYGYPAYGYGPAYSYGYGPRVGVGIGVW